MSLDSPTSRPKQPRPSVVTLACVFVAITAFLSLTELITALMDWGSVDMTDQLRPAIREIHNVMRADHLLGYRVDRPTRCELPPYGAETSAQKD